MKSLQEAPGQSSESLKFAGHMGCLERGIAIDGIETPHFSQSSVSFIINA